MSHILILFYSQHGATRLLAEKIALGASSAGGEVLLRTVPKVTDNLDAQAKSVPDAGAPYVTSRELQECAALALGSPTRFGNMAAPMKYFLDSTSALWLRGDLVDKPACVFTSSSSMHGGQESTLLSMMLPLLHHGMVICGLPYSVPELASTTTGGTPYGVSHVGLDSNEQNPRLSEDEIALCLAQGKRLAHLARKQ
ncbi:NAD(P)H:quinone oxidoreductase [Alteromonas oceanisediminis]|uniref:NAD(P)H:quinone oxidoreductase n=1 Tax=Alteromonas oceanisediminis TaxID=2836180 RepID=UPI001BDB58A4|nr:NAD(P)H:quinone oxidoreductase [Alteromonas oceanisediminis]MBT0586371.1 NAD(P)H:quinone oxidoreductase [Alteromonas oceanisediminis]